MGGLFDQIMGTWILVVVVLAVTDKRNVELPHASVAVVLGLTGKRKNGIYIKI